MLPLSKSGHIAKYCKFSKKVKNLNLDESILNQIEHLLIEDGESDITDNESEQHFNQLEDDDLDSSSTFQSDQEDSTSQLEINVLTKEQDLLLEIISNL
jgi:hypothetical protein